MAAEPSAQGSSTGSSTDKPVETKADQIDFSGETKRIVATGNVVVTYGSTRMTADKVSVDNITKDAHAEGHVHIFTEGRAEWHGDQVQYNFNTGALNAGPARAYSDRYYLAAGKTESESRDHYILRNSEFTTSEYPNPTWKWKCGSVVYYPDEKIIFRNAVLYAGDVPVFYFPYFYYDLDEISIGADVQVGQRSDWGPFILARYRLREDKYLWPILKLDYRARRGVGGGIDMDYGLGYDEKGRPGKLGRGKVETYIMDDDLVRKDPLQDVPIPNGNGVYEARIRPKRYRLKLEQRFDPFEDIETKLKVDKLSDARILADFFENDLRKDQYPDGFFEAQKYDENWTLNLVVRPQVNHFFTTTERLPELSLNVPQQPIGAGFFYDSQTSAGLLSKRHYNDSSQDYNSTRVDSFHQVSHPMKWFDWLNVTPRAGARGTFYTHSQPNGAPTDTSLVRAVYNAGVELSTKIHRTWPGIQNQALQIDGMRHIFEPSIDYTWIPRPNFPSRKILQFDPGVPSSTEDKLRPIQFLEDVGTDSLDMRNVFRPTLRNRWQTKRGGQPYNFLDTIIYQELNLETESDRVLSNLFWGIDFRPTSWLKLRYDSQYNYYDNIIRESNVSVVYQYFKDWELGLSHRFLHDDSTNEIKPSFKWRMNEDWAFRTEQRVNPASGRLRESLYSIDRDLSSWVVSASFRYLNPTVDPRDYQFWIVWTLKEFPEATAQFSP
jgi:lipopolysaccharide assembly outer membrane protein LptD (OstA)